VNYQIRCVVCGAKCWTRGDYESDTNACVLDDNDPLDDACEHIKAGGDYEIVDEEPIDFDS
jgi:hypothetical protein